MPSNTLSRADACSKFISALHEDKDRIEDIVFDDMQKSKSVVMAMIPDGGVVDYNDQTDRIEYTMAGQEGRAYSSIDADPRALVAGQQPGRDANGRTALFDVDVNEQDANACAGFCEFRFGQGYEIQTSHDFRLRIKTPEVCAWDYIRKGPKHVAGYFRGLTKSFREFGTENFDTNLLNNVIQFGEANTSIIAANHFEVTKSGVPGPPQGCLSIAHLRRWRDYFRREKGVLDEYGTIQIMAPREDWRRAVIEDQIREYGSNISFEFKPEMFTDASAGALVGKQYHEYDNIRCVFDECPVRGYYRPAAVVNGLQTYDFVRVYHWKNEENQDGGLSAEPNHDYDKSEITVDGATYPMVTLAPMVHPQAFTRFGLGSPRKYEGQAPIGSNFEVYVRDGAYLNDLANEKFVMVAQHAYRLRVEKPEFAGVIAYRHSLKEGYLISPTTVVEPALDINLSGGEVLENCSGSATDVANCGCDDKEVNANGDCVATSEKGTVILSPCAILNTRYSGTDVIVTLEVERQGNFNGAGTVDYATSDGTATAGTDYTAASGTISWEDGEFGSKEIEVTITDATADGVLFTVTLSNATGEIALGDCVETAVIIEDGQ